MFFKVVWDFVFKEVVGFSLLRRCWISFFKVVWDFIFEGGGHSDTIRLLIERGADPNTRGHFRRTPLYRAAFAGHLEAGLKGAK